MTKKNNCNPLEKFEEIKHRRNTCEAKDKMTPPDDVGNGRRMNFVSWNGVTHRDFERIMLKYLAIEVEEGFVVGFELSVSHTEASDLYGNIIFVEVTVADDEWVVINKQMFTSTFIQDVNLVKGFEMTFVEVLSKTNMIKTIEEWIIGTINKMKEGGE